MRACAGGTLAGRCAGGVFCGIRQSGRDAPPDLCKDLLRAPVRIAVPKLMPCVQGSYRE